MNFKCTKFYTTPYVKINNYILVNEGYLKLTPTRTKEKLVSYINNTTSVFDIAIGITKVPLQELPTNSSISHYIVPYRKNAILCLLMLSFK